MLQIANKLNLLSLHNPQVLVNQVRNKFQNIPKLRNPIWFVRKERRLHDDQITADNSSFIKEVLHDKYGQPALIKGIPAYTNASQSLIKQDDIVQVEWNKTLKRTGAIGRKIGQYPLWLKTGERIRATLIQIIDNHVVKYLPPEEVPVRYKYTPLKRPNSHGALLVGAESTDPSLLTKEYCGLFNDTGVMPKKHLCRFLISPEARLPSGTPINVTHWRVGDAIDIRGLTKDRGFQGVIKRHGFKGMPASHGVTKTHRRPGNIGGGGEKGRVWPGTKLPGHMGNRWRVLKGLTILRMNTKYNVMWVHGDCIPGITNGLVYIYDTILPKRKPESSPPFPTHFETEEDLDVEDIWLPTVHNFKDGSIVFEETVEAKTK